MDGNSEQLQVINLKQLPIIEERLRDVKAKIEQRTSAVMALAVTEETRTDVKKIRTEVRKELEGYEAQRMAVKKAIMTPYEQFEAVYKECVSNPYKAADEALGKKIADVEVGIKQQKEDDVRAFFNELTSGFGLDWLTLLRHIISRWGIMSIEMTTALEHDDAVNVADDGQIVTETVEAARASIPADAQEVPSAEPEAPAPTSEAEPEAVDISTL